MEKERTYECKGYFDELLNVKNDKIFEEVDGMREVDAEVIGGDKIQTAMKKLKWVKSWLLASFGIPLLCHVNVERIYAMQT